MKNAGSWLWGLVLVVLGVIWGLNALGVADIDVFFPGWWTLFIIVPCFIGLLTDEHKLGRLIGLLIGVCLLLGSWDILEFDLVWKLLLPTILVLIGLSIMFKGVFKNEAVKKVRELSREQDESLEEFWATFGEQNVDFAGKDFGGCRVEAIFGGADLDLRGAKLKQKVVVKASSIFGGIVLHVPDDVEVEIASTAIFGGVSDNRKKVQGADKTIYIDATCIFGGVELR